MLRIKLEVLK